MIKHCFKQGCELEVQYVCLCLGSETHCCEFHLKTHLEFSNSVHSFDSILAEPCEWNKAEILEFLEKEKSKKEKLKKIASFSQNCQESLRKVDFDLGEINNLIEKFSQNSSKEENPLWNQLTLQSNPETARVEVKLQNDSDLYSSVKSFCRLSQLKYKTSLILNRTNNDQKTEEDFRRECLLFENDASNSLLSQAYQEYISSYQKITSTYLIRNDVYIDVCSEEDDDDNYCFAPILIIYNTENQREEKKVLEIPEKIRCSEHKGIVHLPNNDLLVCGSIYAFIIDRNYQVKKFLPKMDDKSFTAIYYNRSVYFFELSYGMFLFRRFNLDENRFSILARIPKCYQFLNHIIFNRNILSSIKEKSKILLYSIDIDSFSLIPYKFEKRRRKLLISTEERLYLIENNSQNAWIYESEIGNEYAWTKTEDSIIGDLTGNIYFSYNKGAFYISALYNKDYRGYFKFDLNQKTLTEIVCYGNNLAVKRIGDKFEVTDSYRQTFELNSDLPETYINKELSLYSITKALEYIETADKEIKQDPGDWEAYAYKGHQLHDLGRYFEAIDCFNEAIKLNPNEEINYTDKGHSLRKLKRYVEAIDCFNEAIKLSPNDDEFNYIYKGDSLRKLKRYVEAIECYDQLIKLCDKGAPASFSKEWILEMINLELETVECDKEVSQLDPESYLIFFYRGNILCDLELEEEAIKCFNKAYEPALQIHCGKETLELIKLLSGLLEGVLKFKEEIKKFKDENLNYPEFLNEIEKKELFVKEQKSQLFKKATKYLIRCYDEPREKFMKIQKKAVEHQDNMIDIVTQLNCFYAMGTLNSKSE